MHIVGDGGMPFEKNIANLEHTYPISLPVSGYINIVPEWTNGECAKLMKEPRIWFMPQIFLKRI